MRARANGLPDLRSNGGKHLLRQIPFWSSVAALLFGQEHGVARRTVHLSLADKAAQSSFVRGSAAQTNN
jgi:hypothetical protein